MCCRQYAALDMALQDAYADYMNSDPAAPGELERATTQLIAVAEQLRRLRRPTLRPLSALEMGAAAD